MLSADQIRGALRIAFEEIADSMEQRLFDVLAQLREPRVFLWKGHTLGIDLNEADNIIVFEYQGERKTLEFPFNSSNEEHLVIDYGEILDRELGNYRYKGVSYSALDEMLAYASNVIAPSPEQLNQIPSAELRLYAPELSSYVPFLAENGSYYGQFSEQAGKPKTVYVKSYFRKDGTYVKGHYRSAP